LCLRVHYVEATPVDKDCVRLHWRSPLGVVRLGQDHLPVVHHEHLLLACALDHKRRSGLLHINSVCQAQSPQACCIAHALQLQLMQGLHLHGLSRFLPSQAFEDALAGAVLLLKVLKHIVRLVHCPFWPSGCG
jgi:hypothetical protein